MSKQDCEIAMQIVERGGQGVTLAIAIANAITQAREEGFLAGRGFKSSRIHTEEQFGGVQDDSRTASQDGR